MTRKWLSGLCAAAMAVCLAVSAASYASAAPQTKNEEEVTLEDEGEEMLGADEEAALSGSSSAAGQTESKQTEDEQTQEENGSESSAADSGAKVKIEEEEPDPEDSESSAESAEETESEEDYQPIYTEYTSPDDEDQDDTRLITAADWPEGPELGADGAILIDAQTGTVLYEKNANHTFYPASITKIMTALLAVENSSLDDILTFSSNAVRSVPNGYASIAASPGEEMTVEDAIYATLLPSANDAANGLGEFVGGSIERFADMMNARAEELGCLHTHFVNPSGIHNEAHVTTPYDMAQIMRACIANEDFMAIDSSRTYTIDPTNKQPEERTIYNLHRMLFSTRKEYYEYAVGGKTGYTTPALNTLVTYAEKDGMKLISVVMHCNNTTYEDTKSLLEYGFNNFTMYQASQTDDRYTPESDSFFDSDILKTKLAGVSFEDDGWVILPSTASFFDTDAQLTYTDQEEGSDRFAEVTYTYQGMQVGKASLCLQMAEQEKFVFDNIASGSEETGSQENASQAESGETAGKTFLQGIDVRWIAAGAAAVVLVIALIVLIINLTSGRKRRIREGKKRRKIKFKARDKL